MKYDEVRLRDAMTDFYNSTGINIQLISPDFSRLGESVGVHNRYCEMIQKTKGGSLACNISDEVLLRRCRDTRRMQMHVCHAGLIDIAVPIIHEDEILAYIILGQLKKEAHFSNVKALIDTLAVSTSEMESCYSALTVYDEQRIQSVANIASMLAKYILLEHLIKLRRNTATERALTYINAHLDQPLSVRQISNGANVSKSVLYKNFHAEFGCTVSEYLNACRIERAAVLLRTTALTVEEISQRVGFSGVAYFSKKFKQHKKISPLRYRKTQHKDPE